MSTPYRTTPADAPSARAVTVTIREGEKSTKSAVHVARGVEVTIVVEGYDDANSVHIERRGATLCSATANERGEDERWVLTIPSSTAWSPWTDERLVVCVESDEVDGADAPRARVETIAELRVVVAGARLASVALSMVTMALAVAYHRGVTTEFANAEAPFSLAPIDAFVLASLAAPLVLATVGRRGVGWSVLPTLILCAFGTGIAASVLAMTTSAYNASESAVLSDQRSLRAGVTRMLPWDRPLSDRVIESSGLVKFDPRSPPVCALPRGRSWLPVRRRVAVTKPDRFRALTRESLRAASVGEQRCDPARSNDQWCCLDLAHEASLSIDRAGDADPFHSTLVLYRNRELGPTLPTTRHEVSIGLWRSVGSLHLYAQYDEKTFVRWVHNEGLDRGVYRTTPVWQNWSIPSPAGFVVSTGIGDEEWLAASQERDQLFFAEVPEGMIERVSGAWVGRPLRGRPAVLSLKQTADGRLPTPRTQREIMRWWHGLDDSESIHRLRALYVDLGRAPTSAWSAFVLAVPGEPSMVSFRAESGARWSAICAGGEPRGVYTVRLHPSFRGARVVQLLEPGQRPFPIWVRDNAESPRPDLVFFCSHIPVNAWLWPMQERSTGVRSLFRVITDEGRVFAARLEPHDSAVGPELVPSDDPPPPLARCCLEDDIPQTYACPTDEEARARGVELRVVPDPPPTDCDVVYREARSSR
ncbi:MAG: hypothetical protein JNK05_06955 [Myxococcales bacterium]|nr:hypothetical protein [Myxococcales bacterium]